MLAVVPLYRDDEILVRGLTEIEHQQLMEDFNKVLHKHPNTSFIGRACGYSMEGLDIFDGNWLVIEGETQQQACDVIVARLNGEWVCKYFDRKKRVLYSAHPDYHPYALSAEDSFIEEGIVACSIAWERPE